MCSAGVSTRRSRKHLARLSPSLTCPPAKRSSTNPPRTTADRIIAEEAARRGMPVYEPNNPNVPEFVATMRALEPDLFLAVGYMFRLKAEILAVPRIVSANVHASLLPAYRGRSPVFWALRHGERYSGLTIHAMDDGWTRAICCIRSACGRARTTRFPRCTIGSSTKGVKLVPRLIADAERGRLPRKSHAGERRLVFFRGKRGRFPPRLVARRRRIAALDRHDSGPMLHRRSREAHFPPGCKNCRKSAERPPRGRCSGSARRVARSPRATVRCGSAWSELLRANRCRCRNSAAKWDWRSAIRRRRSIAHEAAPKEDVLMPLVPFHN